MRKKQDKLSRNFYEDVFDKKNAGLYINKHQNSIKAMWAITHKEDYKKELKVTRFSYLFFLIAILLFGFNVFIITNQTSDNLYVSKSDEDHSFIKMMTMPWPVLTPPAIEKWAAHAITNIMSVGFNDFDHHIKKIRPFFTDAGYEGIVQAFNKNYREQIVGQNENMITVPTGAPRMTHYPNKMEKWFTVEIPIISSFDNGDQTTISSRPGVAVLIIGPTDGGSAEFGKAIQKITIQ